MAKSPENGNESAEPSDLDDQATENNPEISEEQALPETDGATEEELAEAVDSDEDTVEDGVSSETEEAETSDDVPDVADDAENLGDEEVEEAADLSDADTEPATDPEPEPATTPPATQSERVVVEQRGGFFPMALGGLVAAALGYGVAWFQGQGGEDLTAALNGQSERIATLESNATALQAEIAALGDGPDLSGIEGQIADLMGGIETATGRLDAVQAEVTGTVQGMTDRIAEMDARLTDVEQRPIATGDGAVTLAEEAIAAYEREVSSLREEMQAQADRLGSMTAEAEAQLQTARDEILAAEEAAAEAARAAEARAALGRVSAAVDTGQPFAGALADLAATSGVDIPAALQAAADEGVQTTRALQDGFPDAARAALGAARDEGVADGGSGVGGLLRSTFNARSVTPREGTDPDAVLSRVGAAVSEGRMTDALAEAETLPEVVRAAMSDWLGAAQSRADALSALEALSQVVNDN